MSESDRILKRLLALHPKLIDLSLGRITHLLDRLGNPHLRLPPVIHIAGTNGKGSTLAFIQAMMEAAGFQVHVYTSPHLIKFHERISLGSKSGSAPISEIALAKVLEECERVNAGAPITFFEITTAAAFLAFSRHEADYVLLETGLGGRFDATNLIPRPALTLITPISHDHHDFLGETLSEIAREKAGIMKQGTPCISGPQEAEADAVLQSEAERNGAGLLRFGQDWQAYEQHGRLIYQDMSGLLDLPLPGLRGRHQYLNAGLAVAAVRALAPHGMTDEAVEEGLKKARWPGRLQQLSGALTHLLPPGAEIWLDGGHNPAAGQALAQAMAEVEEKAPRPLVLIAGMMAIKDAAGFLSPFRGLVSQVVTLAIPGEENAADAGELAATAAEQGFAAYAAADLIHAIQAALEASGSIPPRILITGSLYLAGHVLEADQSKTPDK